MKPPTYLSLVSSPAAANFTQQTRLENTLAGVVDALSYLREWAGVLGVNELSRRLVFRKEPPFSDGGLAGRALDDRDFDRIRLWFQDAKRITLSKHHLVDGARIVAGWNTFHPVREFLEGLTWDGTPRVDTWLEAFCAVRPKSLEHAEMIRAVGRKWLISCVARAMKPGCKVDTMLVLEGRQGIGKSTALATLAGDGFYCDTQIDLGRPEACRTLQGVWIYELAELGAVLRRETSVTKGFLTSSSDRFHLPYGRFPESVPRSVVFCGTVNHTEYLRDGTGNRRFWVVRCEETLPIEGLRAARSGLWAEARHLYERGEPWHLEPHHEAAMSEEHELRLDLDTWHEPIAAWTALRGEVPFSMDELLVAALERKGQARNPRVTGRVSRILESLGFERRKKSTSPRAYHYVRRVPEASTSHCPT